MFHPALQERDGRRDDKFFSLESLVRLNSSRNAQ